MWCRLFSSRVLAHKVLTRVHALWQVAPSVIESLIGAAARGDIVLVESLIRDFSFGAPELSEVSPLAQSACSFMQML